jgi:hypothetical protein
MAHLVRHHVDRRGLAVVGLVVAEVRVRAVPVRVDVTTRTGGVLPLPRMPLRLNQARTMSASRCTDHIASTQAVSRLVPEPLPQTSSVPVYAEPFCPPHLRPGRVVSVIEYDEPDPEVLMLTLP